MRVKRPFNNNVLLAETETGEEVIFMGKGIAFKVMRSMKARFRRNSSLIRRISMTVLPS